MMPDDIPDNAPDSPKAAPKARHKDSNEDTNQWAMFLHLSQLLGWAIPVLGFAAPIVIWQIKKDRMPAIDRHGREVVNWMISLLIYASISFILMFILIGIPLLYALGAIAVIFPIIGGIKAGQGEFWSYPLSISFLSVPGQSTD